jgi:DNA-binding NtrC family response regulator
MGDRILVFHNDLEYLSSTEAALRAAGFEVVALDDSFQAWELLAGSNQRFDVLVTRTAAAQGAPPGLALARLFRMIRPGAPVVITAAPDNAHFAAGLGEVLLAPVTAQDVVAAVRSAVVRPIPGAAEGG